MTMMGAQKPRRDCAPIMCKKTKTVTKIVNNTTLYRYVTDTKRYIVDCLMINRLFAGTKLHIVELSTKYNFTVSDINSFSSSETLSLRHPFLEPMRLLSRLVLLLW